MRRPVIAFEKDQRQGKRPFVKYLILREGGFGEGRVAVLKRTFLAMPEFSGVTSRPEKKKKWSLSTFH